MELTPSGARLTFSELIGENFWRRCRRRWLPERTDRTGGVLLRIRGCKEHLKAADSLSRDCGEHSTLAKDSAEGVRSDVLRNKVEGGIVWVGKMCVREFAG